MILSYGRKIKFRAQQSKEFCFESNNWYSNSMTREVSNAIWKLVLINSKLFKQKRKKEFFFPSWLTFDLCVTYSPKIIAASSNANRQIAKSSWLKRGVAMNERQVNSHILNTCELWGKKRRCGAINPGEFFNYCQKVVLHWWKKVHWLLWNVTYNPDTKLSFFILQIIIYFIDSFN